MLAASVATLAGPAAAPADAAAPPPHLRLSTIQPGRHPMVDVLTPVNVIFVGYRPGTVDVGRIVRGLPATSEPVIRSPQLFGMGADPALGLRYDYSYHVRFAGSAFDDAFFAHLAASGFMAPIDPYMQLYNAQQHNTLDVPPTLRLISADDAEAWLEQQADSRLGIPAGQDTVFLVNWYGRHDFQFHAYLNCGHPDPDTGVDAGCTNLGLTRGWGGHSGTSWFYDLSANPVWSDESWVIDTAEFGNLPISYFIPPIWEYGNTSGYRPFTDLAKDLGLLIRYVALDTLFTSSPLYDPATSLPGPDGAKQIDLSIFEGDPSRSGLADVHPDVLRAQHQWLEPYYGIDVQVQDHPLAGGILDAYDTWTGDAVTPGCWNELGTPYAEMFCYLRDHRSDYFPPTGENAVIPAAGFTVADPDATFKVGAAGYTESDYVDAGASVIEVLDTPRLRGGQGIAYTLLTMHEAGHFVGLSHPHDGYDPPSGVDFGPVGAFGFAWAGDASATVMSYLWGEQRFSEFDRDNLARWQVARLLDLSNADAAAIIATGPNAQAAGLLLKADTEFSVALVAMHTSSWMQAATSAAAGYRDVQRADAAAGVTPARANGTAAAADASGAVETNAAAAHLGTVGPSAALPVPGSHEPGTVPLGAGARQPTVVSYALRHPR